MMPSGLQYSDRSDQNRLRLLQQRAEEQRTFGQMLPQYEQVNYHTDKVQMPDSTSSMQMLNVGSTHHVYVSHMEEGPNSFFVQLKVNAEDALPRLTNLLKQQKPVPHTPPLMPGSMVMTHVLSDNTFRRSIVMNIRHDSCLVYHMDYGNSEDIPCSEIYQLPPQARHAPAMALRFCLADIKSQQVSDSAKAYFQEFLERKCVLIRVVHEEHGNPLYQYCEMFYDNKSVKEILWTFNSPLEYTSQLHPRGKDVKVTVSVVESPAQFYVQYTSKLDIINNIQESVNAYCATQTRLQDLSSISIGSPVAALFEDNTWYRAMVVELNKDISVKVLYVDYGNRSDVVVNHLCQISRELVTKWRTQAVECCLVGFENCGDLSEEIKEKMVNRTLGLSYHLRLMSILNSSRLLVDLIDNLGGKVSEDITYTPPTQIITPYRETHPHFQKPKDHTPTFDATTIDSGEHKGKFKSDSTFTRPNQRQSSFHSMESPYSEHDNRDVDQNKNRGYNRQKSFDKGSRFKSDEGYKKSDNFEEDKSRRNRYSDEKGGRSSVGSRGSDEHDEKPRRGYGGPRSRPDDDKASEQTSEERPRRGGGFNRQRDDERGSDQVSDERPRRSFNTRPRTDEDKTSDQYSEDKTRRGFRGPRQDDDRGRGPFGGRDRFNKREGGDDSNNKRFGRGGDDHERKGGRAFGEDSERRGGRGFGEDSDRRGGRGFGEDSERRGGRGFGEDSERRGGRGYGGGGNKWGGGEGDSEDKPWKDGRRREDVGDKRFGGPRRGNWNKEDGGSGGSGSDFRKKKYENDFSSSKRFSQDSSNEFNTKKVIAAAEDDWGGAAPELTKPPTTPTNAITEYPMRNILVNTTMKVHLSYMQNPHVFYVQPEGCEADLDEIRTIIDADFEASLVSIKDASLPLGTPVLARFSVDQLLYRGLVQQVFPPTSAQVLFIDYGNYDSVPTNDLYLITSNLALKVPIAIRCSLVDVSPVGTDWTASPDEYTKHFEYDDAMAMNIVSVKMLDGELVAQVKLTSPTGEPISHLLSENGLAVNIGKPCSTPSEDKVAPTFNQKKDAPDTIAAEPAPVAERVPGKIKATLPDKWVDRFDLLAGQRFYSTVLETIEENLFVVSITEAKVIALAGAMKDQQHIPLLDPGTDLIIEVKVVKEERLNVLFFNMDGSQMNPKEGVNPRWVNPICPFPVIRRTDHVTVAYSEGAVVYIQRLSDADRLAKLMDDMYNFYENTQPDPEAQWRIGDICAAKSDLDSNWYRASLINSPKENTVRYLDYGSKEVLSVTNFRRLDPQFIFSELCLNVFMSVYWRSPNPPLLDIVESEELFAKFTRDSNGKWIVDLAFADGDKVTKKLVEQNIAQEKNESPFEDQNIIIGSDLTAGESVSIVVSHDDSITMFWAQMMKHINKIDELQDRLQSMIENLNNGAPDKMKVFAAQYSEDGIWYRATKVGDNSLRFIDYGNMDSISEQVKELPPDMMKPSSGFAVPMYLCVKPINGEWSEQAIEIHQTFIEKPSIVAEIINVDYKVVVDIKADGKLLSEALIEAGFAEYYDYIPDFVKKYKKEEIMTFKPICQSISVQLPVIGEGKKDIKNPAVVQLVTESTELEHPNISEHDRVFVILPTSLNDFYIQEELKTDTVDEIQNRLLTVELIKFTGTVEIGQLFAVQFEEDDLWYRAKVISIEPKVQVSFIDYGNIVTTTDLRILPEDVISHPPLAIHCSLNTKETPELLSSFLTLTNFGQTPFLIKFNSYGNPHIVSLLTKDGRDVLDILLCHSTAILPATTRKLPTEEELLEESLEQNDEELLDQQSSRSQPSLQKEIELSLKMTMELMKTEFNVAKPGYITHINSISDFYIQEIGVMPVLEQINNKFSDFDKLNKTIVKVKTGDLVAAKYVDECWYRGVVMQTEPEIIIQFIDYGNESVVTEIYDLPNGLKNLPPVAIKCCLSVDENIVSNCEEKFLEISGGGATFFEFKVLSKNGCMHVVELMVEGRNILLDLTNKIVDSISDAELSSEKNISPDTDGSTGNEESKKVDPICETELVNPPREVTELSSEKNISTATDASTVNKKPEKVVDDNKESEESSENAAASFAFIKGPDDFYLCMKTSESDNVSKILDEAETFETAEAAKIGDGVVVKFDGKWLRGKILEKDESSYLVFLIDHGQAITCSDVKKLPVNLSAIPPLSVHCSLQLPQDSDAWHPEAAAEFLQIYEDLIIDKYSILEKSSKPYIVKLITNKGDLTTILKDFNLSSEFQRAINLEKSDIGQSCSLEESSKDVKIQNDFEENQDLIIPEDTIIKDNQDLNHNNSNVSEDTTMAQEHLNNGVTIVEDNKTLSETDPLPEVLADNDRDTSSESSELDVITNNVNKEVANTNGSMAKKVMVNKPVKTLAEIKASAKPRIVTRLSKTPDRHTSNKSVTSPPVTKVKSEPQLDEDRSSPISSATLKGSLPRAHSLTMDERPLPGSLSQPPSPDLSPRTRLSKVDKIVPGAISGNIMTDADQD